MVFVIAIVLAAGAVIGVGKKEGVFAKGYDTTRRDTVAFEKKDLQERLVREQTKHRQVVELTPGTSNPKLARSEMRQDKLEARILKLENLEKEMGWDRQ